MAKRKKIHNKINSKNKYKQKANKKLSKKTAYAIVKTVDTISSLDTKPEKEVDILKFERKKQKKHSIFYYLIKHIINNGFLFNIIMQFFSSA